MSSSLESWFEQRVALILRFRDVLEGRVEGPAAPAWCDRRGWSEVLLALGDEDLARCEELGLDAALVPAAVPADLMELATSLRTATFVPAWYADGALDRGQTHRVRARKRPQLAALLALAQHMARDAQRIVDVGTGHGHLPRLASATWEKHAVGVDRDAALLEVARELAPRARVEFVRVDAFEQRLGLASSDLVMGLHACGELGDTLLRDAAACGASVVLVSCCFQKVRTPTRPALSQLGRRLGFELPHASLGLANLSQRAMGVEVSLRDTMRARTTRYALRLLLRARGVETRPGEEMRGINRRRALAGLQPIAHKALALRGLPLPSPEELAHCAELAARDFGVMRRLSLPRTMLARLLEVTLVTDRAVFLQEQGYTVRMATVFEPEVSPRNLGIFGTHGGTAG